MLLGGGGAFRFGGPRKEVAFLSSVPDPDPDPVPGPDPLLSTDPNCSDPEGEYGGGLVGVGGVERPDPRLARTGGMGLNG